MHDADNGNSVRFR